MRFNIHTVVSALALSAAVAWGIAQSAEPPNHPDLRTGPNHQTNNAPREKTAIVIPVEEEVDFGLFAFLKRSVAQALEKHPDVIVFKINTYGGELQSAFDIVDLMTGIKACSTYAFVEQKAISAGALIALSSNHIAMGASTTIGDCAPITQGNDGIIMLGEKIQSPLRAKFRTLAERNGYPSLLAQAMVTADLGVVTAKKNGAKETEFFTAKQWAGLSDKDKAAYSEHKTLVPEGQLLTMTDREAKEYGFSIGSYTNLDEFLRDRHWRQSEEIQTTWSENLVRIIGKFSPILMLIGFGALYMEFKTPGLSIFGVIGVVCLAIVFGSKYAVGLANHTELLILLMGFSLFFVEMYLFPGTFIAGFLGVLLVIAALTLSLQTFTVPDPTMPWELKGLIDHLSLTLGMAMLALFIPLLALRFVIPYLPGQAKVVADATLADARAVDPVTAKLPVGTTGTTKTALRPTGKAQFGEETVQVSSRGEFIEPGLAVEVCQILGNKIVVRRKEIPA